MNAPDLAAENAELRARLAEAEETLEAIRSGGVDALVTTGPAGAQVFTLSGAETPYRLLLEAMNEGAATVARDGTVLYGNHRLAEMAGLPLEQLIGGRLCQCVVPEQQPGLRQWIATAAAGGSQAEFTFEAAGKPPLPVLLSLRPLLAEPTAVAVVATDLSERHAHEAKLRQLNQELEQRVQRRTAELQAIFDTAPVGLAITEDPAALSIRGNPALERALGLAAAAELSLAAQPPPPYRCRHEGRELPTDQLPMQRAARGQTVSGFLMEVVRADGQTLTLHSNAVPLLDAQGRPCGAVGAFLDITERLRAGQALRQSEQQLRTLSDSMPQLAWMARPDGFLYWYNRRWYEYTGTTPAQMEGWGWQSVHDPQMLPQVLEQWKKALGTGEPFEMVFPLRGADGLFRRFLTRAQPLKDARGSVLQWFGTNTDVDELKRVEEALSATNAELTHFNELMVGRELRMIELKQEINALCAQLGEAPRYASQIEIEEEKY